MDLASARVSPNLSLGLATKRAERSSQPPTVTRETKQETETCLYSFSGVPLTASTKLPAAEMNLILLSLSLGTSLAFSPRLSSQQRTASASIRRRILDSNSISPRLSSPRTASASTQQRIFDSITTLTDSHVSTGIEVSETDAAKARIEHSL